MFGQHVLACVLTHTPNSRAFLFSAMIIGLGCISVALFIMVNEYLNGGDEVGTKWPGIALMIQNLLIFVRYASTLPISALFRPWH